MRRPPRGSTRGRVGDLGCGDGGDERRPGDRAPTVLVVSPDDADVAYLRLAGHPGPGAAGVVHRSVRLRTLLAYVGPEVVLDLDADGRLIGVEVLG